MYYNNILYSYLRIAKQLSRLSIDFKHKLNESSSKAFLTSKRSYNQEQPKKHRKRINQVFVTQGQTHQPYKSVPRSSLKQRRASKDKQIMPKFYLKKTRKYKIQ